MTEELCRKLYYLSFSNEKVTGTVIAQIIETFNQAMALKKTVVCLKSSDCHQIVASSGHDEIMENIRQEGFRYSINNYRGKEIGELYVVPWENTCFSLSEEKMLNALINQLAGLLERLVPPEADACLFEEVDRYKQLLTIDKLTGVYNRYQFEETMDKIEREKHYPVSLVFVDVDGLKIINDYLGHKYGDMALKETALLLKKAFRENDLVARVGGDEFAILLPFTQRKIAEMRCKSLTEALKLYNKENNIPPLSFSVGVATTSGLETIREIFHLADLEMYKQKQKNLLKYGNFLRSRCLSISTEVGTTLQHQCLL
ncbi:MAG: GGDEF domain-containing protein [Clostridiales bacterium]|jgi:diguanylate cyclase (GGDEF)-like protein|nr:GGDEF domain-containing protein [Clostridiales bacterium]